MLSGELPTPYTSSRLAESRKSNDPIFYRNLEQVLEKRRADGTIYSIPRSEGAPESVDFKTFDILSLTSSGTLRRIYLDELATESRFKLNDGVSRVMGNSSYTSETEHEIAAFHGAETALLLKSGWDANGAIMSAIPQRGDVIVYDELIHASFHEGMKLTRASTKISFKHNDVDDFRQTLTRVRQSYPLIGEDKRCLLISVESLYSMDGDVTPLAELVAVAKEIFPKGNAQFVIDEAHSTGVIGKGGSGLVNMLGLEKDIAIRVHTYSKAIPASGGAVILCNETVRSMLINYGRVVIYSNSPQFSMVGPIRIAYRYMRSGQIEALQVKLQEVIRHFYRSITSHPVYRRAVDAGILSVPNADGFESKQFLSHISYIMTRQCYNEHLFCHLLLRNFSVLAVGPPVVPKGTKRVRLVFHADHTDAQIESLAGAICEWAYEMLETEASEKAGSSSKISYAAQQVFMNQDGAKGIVVG